MAAKQHISHAGDVPCTRGRTYALEMINADVLDAAHLKPFKLLILPNITRMSDTQCDQIRKFVEGGGSLLATFETSLYDGEETRGRILA